MVEAFVDTMMREGLTTNDIDAQRFVDLSKPKAYALLMALVVLIAHVAAALWKVTQRPNDSAAERSRNNKSNLKIGQVIQISVFAFARDENVDITDTSRFSTIHGPAVVKLRHAVIIDLIKDLPNGICVLECTTFGSKRIRKELKPYYTDFIREDQKAYGADSSGTSICYTSNRTDLAKTTAYLNIATPTYL